MATESLGRRFAIRQRAEWLTTMLRWLLGLVFIVASPNHYLQFVKDPPMPAQAVELHHALTASGYIFQLVVATEFIGGVLLVVDAAVPFALVILAPIIVNILCFHLFLAPGGLPVAIALVAMELILAWRYRESFEGLFRAERRRPHRQI
jgi:uncharacterized membrane protein YphA (DoxX/SURF4 family)